MKVLTYIFNFFLTSLVYGSFLLSCTSEEPDAAPGNQTTGNQTSSGDLTIQDLDKLSDHLKFFGATISPGKPPAAPGGSALKISIRDTLNMAAGIPMPIKFLHDEQADITGVYVQVRSFQGSTGGILYGTNFFEVPEVAETAESDTVSVVMIGFDPTDFDLPLSFEIDVIPVGPSGQPLDETTIPVVVEELGDPSSGDDCGLVMPGFYWSWSHSFITYPVVTSETPQDSIFRFFYAPDVIWDGTQSIKGCCIAGNSDYGATCSLGRPEDERTLPFDTYYQQAYESFDFFENHTFKRITVENSANPLPDESDYCSGSSGVVYVSIKNVLYEGDWTATPSVTVIPESPFGFGSGEEGTFDYLTLRTTTSTGNGWGNPGGWIVYVTCSQLLLVQPDREGGTDHLWKFYQRIGPDGVSWYDLHH